MELLWTVLGDLLTPKGGWSAHLLLKIIISTLSLVGYVIALARLFGSRTFATFTSYDFLVNIAAGSLVASAILGDSLVESGLSLLVLVLAQWAISAGSARWGKVQRTFDNMPVILIEHGVVQVSAMRGSRVARASLDQALRDAGFTSPDGVKFAVLESGGTISVVAA